MIKRLRLGAVSAALTVQALALGASGAPQVTTFVQLNDVHLFDAESDEAWTANVTAVNWAVLRINEMVMSGKTIDFVVFTGGLEVAGAAGEEFDGAVVVRDLYEPGDVQR